MIDNINRPFDIDSNKSRDEESQQRELYEFYTTKVLPFLGEFSEENFYHEISHYEEHDIRHGNDFFKEIYDDFIKESQSDPNDTSNFSILIVLMGLLSFMKKADTEDIGISFVEIKEIFIERARATAESLYRTAFFRNTYDTVDAWEICGTFKRYKRLFEALDVMPEGALERIANMSKELDEIWSSPEFEEMFRAEMVDKYDRSLGVDNMVSNIYSTEPTNLLSEEEHSKLYELRSDMVPEKYEDYIDEMEKRKHPYVLDLKN